MAEIIKVLISDDHDILREGLVSLIGRRHDISVVGEAANAGECLERAAELEPDVIIMDIQMPGLSPFEACEQLKARRPEMKVIVLSMYDDYEYVDKALKVGADGYLVKKVAGAELVDAIRRVNRGERVFSADVLDMLISSLQDSSATQRDVSPIRSLTERELDVLRLISQGLRNKQIAAKLYVSPKTVEKAISNIYRKLGVDSRGAAIRMFLDAETKP
jgi:DNA-binding NarL/FixJ family response regulator